MADRKRTEALTYQEALQYAMRLCARQEMYRKYIKEKLSLRKALTADIDRIIDYLEENRFLDESRYARAFVNDKMKLSRWGVSRIKMALMQKGIPSFIINEVTRGLEANELYENGLYLARKKLKTLKNDKPVNRQRKVYNFLAYRGYDTGMIWRIIKETGAGCDEPES